MREQKQLRKVARTHTTAATETRANQFLSAHLIRIFLFARFDSMSVSLRRPPPRSVPIATAADRCLCPLGVDQIRFHLPRFAIHERKLPSAQRARAGRRDGEGDKIASRRTKTFGALEMSAKRSENIFNFHKSGDEKQKNNSAEARVCARYICSALCIPSRTYDVRRKCVNEAERQNEKGKRERRRR